MRATYILVLGAVLATFPGYAGEWDNEGRALTSDCGAGGLSVVATCGAFLFNSGKPVRFMIPTSVVPGGGTALGAQYVHQLDIPNWAESNLTIDGGSSLREFWFTDLNLTLNHRRFGGEWNTARDAFRIQVYSHARGLPQMPFYGIGPNTSRSNITDFTERDITAGASVFVPLKSWFATGGSTEFLQTHIGNINDSSVRSIGTYYNEATAPGLARQPNFAHYTVFVQPRREWLWTQVHSQVAYHYYQDPSSGRYSTRKFRAEFLQRIYPESQHEATGGGTSVRRQPKYDSVLYIGGRFTAESAATGHVVPFYLQETIGGSDIEGVPALRGFQDYRFRAPNLFYLQAQYERRLLRARPAGEAPSTFRSIASSVGIMAFYDTGEVAARLSDLDMSNLRHSFGFGLTFWSGNKVWFRAYVGLGSGEGLHNFVGVTNPGATQFHM